MAAQSDTELRQGALSSRTRRQVLAALSETQHPLDAAAVAERFGIHVTTARFHLEQLETVGLIERNVQRAGQRGRPRVVFSVAPPVNTEDALRQLNSVLVDALTHDSDGGRSRARDAGERWSHAYEDEPDAGTDDAIPLMQVFARLGFEPELRDDTPAQVGSAGRVGSAGDDRIIELHGCPFRDEAIAHPEVVCSAHRGLLDGTLQRLGHRADEAKLLPLVEPGLCLVYLGGSLAAG